MTGEQFYELRKHLDWTQAQTAKELGVSVQQVSAIENGRSNVTPTMAILFSLLADLADNDLLAFMQMDAGDQVH